MTGDGAAGARVAGVLLAIDPASGEPPFRQLKTQIVDAVTSGRLTPGTRLPAVRTLAAEVGISTATAAKVYRELEEAGLLEGRGRSGTFVSAADVADAALARAAEGFAEQSSGAGFGLEDALEAVRNAFKNLD
ncbi:MULTISPECIES: GntR family transcriptional regulator [Dietzia]|uniref:GntR family transcriptional regulator n=1 Tax=Dietzia maris TaxID=37915 RepID=A0ABT8H0W8_9ACTN|nr:MULTISPECIES: GntR family transcriptional regulator [Dietzia]MDJ0423679.1 GntR family transcriptional regulator [Dietzia kunjamensis]MDN4505619.1 GntR family transcriptional regulator [Dietzia maris]